MEDLKIEELKSIDGGGISSPLITFTLISVGIPFVCGLFDGLIQPVSCN